MKLLLLRLGKLLVDVKKFKTFAKDVGTKTVRKQFGGGKRNTTVELIEPDLFLKKVDRKRVALANTFSTI